MMRALALSVSLGLVGIACASRAPEAPAPLSLAPAPTEGPRAAGSSAPSDPADPPGAAPAGLATREHPRLSAGHLLPRDEGNVGACKTSADCPATAHCQGAVCLCNAGALACGGTCVSGFDKQNCGRCGNVCTDTCLRGIGGRAACGQCTAPLASCRPNSGECTNLDDDSLNCGACGKACGKNTTCHRGACLAQRALGASCTDDAQCAALPGSCVEGKCDCTGSYSREGSKCKANSSF